MIHVHDAGILGYRPAWDLQLSYHEEVLSGRLAHGVLILVEHPPVVTIGRHPGAGAHLLAGPKLLAARGVEVVETDRGGDITFHGPGQLVAYPILPLNTYGLNLHTYMRLLEQVAIGTVGAFGIRALRDPAPTPATGVWVDPASPFADVSDGAGNDGQRAMAKICAVGIKVRRWVTLHGLALNVTTDLSYFELINPCGLSRPVTSMQKILDAGGRGTPMPPMSNVKEALIHELKQGLAGVPSQIQIFK